MLYSDWLNTNNGRYRAIRLKDMLQYSFTPTYVGVFDHREPYEFQIGVERWTAWCKTNCIGKYFIETYRHAIFLEMEEDVMLIRLALPEFVV